MQRSMCPIWPSIFVCTLVHVCGQAGWLALGSTWQKNSVHLAALAETVWVVELGMGTIMDCLGMQRLINFGEGWGGLKREDQGGGT